jgi:uncharacterized protein YecT (DUF1311 family)
VFDRTPLDPRAAAGQRVRYQSAIASALCVALVAALPTLSAATARAASPVEECTDRSPTIAGISACLDEMLKRAEDRMWARSKAVLVEMKQLRKQAGSHAAAQLFSAAQKQFHGYRAAQCAWVATHSEIRQGAERLRMDCMIRITRERTLELAGVLPPEATPLEEKPAANPPPEAPALSPFGVEWHLVQLIMNGQEQPLSAESRVVLVLSEGGGVAGTTRASIYSGRYVLGPNNRIAWLQNAFNIERASGQFDADDPDEAILDDLAATTKLRVDSTGLTLTSDNGSVVLVFGR